MLKEIDSDLVRLPRRLAWVERSYLRCYHDPREAAIESPLAPVSDTVTVAGRASATTLLLRSLWRGHGNECP